MNSEAYIVIFQELGFHDIDLRKKLKHPRLRPTLYFNRSRDKLVYFTIYTKDADCFKANLWDFIAPQQKKDDRPSLKTVTPKKGMEEQAFRDILT